MSESLEIQEMLRRAMLDRYGEAEAALRFRAMDTICSATQDRQDAVLRMLDEGGLDLMVVIGGYNSSNTQALARICAARLPTYHIDAADCVGGDAAPPARRQPRRDHHRQLAARRDPYASASPPAPPPPTTSWERSCAACSPCAAATVEELTRGYRPLPYRTRAARRARVRGRARSRERARARDRARRRDSALSRLPPPAHPWDIVFVFGER